MTMQRLKMLNLAMLVPFTVLSAYAVYDVGFVGVLEHQFSSSGGVQVWVDLAIALIFLMTWMVPHAKRTGRNPWPYVVATLIAGCFGPMSYIALAKSDDPVFGA